MYLVSGEDLGVRRYDGFCAKLEFTNKRVGIGLIPKALLWAVSGLGLDATSTQIVRSTSKGLEESVEEYKSSKLSSAYLVPKDLAY